MLACLNVLQRLRGEVADRSNHNSIIITGSRVYLWLHLRVLSVFVRTISLNHRSRSVAMRNGPKNPFNTELEFHIGRVIVLRNSLHEKLWSIIGNSCLHKIAVRSQIIVRSSTEIVDAFVDGTGSCLLGWSMISQTPVPRLRVSFLQTLIYDCLPKD